MHLPATHPAVTILQPKALEEGALLRVPVITCLNHSAESLRTCPAFTAAMADDDDYGGMEDLDFDWIYVEDDFPLSVRTGHVLPCLMITCKLPRAIYSCRTMLCPALPSKQRRESEPGVLSLTYAQDELAETQIPDPGYAGTNFEIYQDHDDMDLLSYWEEREYIDDEYWDNAQLGALASKSTAKRKREESIKESPGAKRRRVLMESMDNVKYVSLARRLEMYYQPPPSLEAMRAFALLPDWQRRFANDTGVITEKVMPEAMKQAAEAQDEETPPKKPQHDVLVEDGDGDEWMDEDEAEGEGDEGEDVAAQLASLGPEALKAVLRQKFGDAMLGEAEEAAIMQTLSKILAGDQGADDAAGDLASALLGQATQGGDSALTGWLSRQGVSLDAAEDEDGDDASSVATTELPSGVSKAAKSNVQVSPPDSAIEISKQNGETKQMAMHGSSPSASVKKRAAPVDDEDEGASKRKKVVFDVPRTSESTYLTADENSNFDSTHPVDTQADASTSEDPLMSDPTIHSTASKPETNSEKTKATNDNAVKTNKSTSAISAGAKNYTKPTAAASAKQSRKRKAEVDGDEDEIVVTAPKQKRPARKAAKTEPEAPKTEPPARRTRSARAKAGK